MDISEKEASLEGGGGEKEECGFCAQQHACREAWSQERRGPFSSAGLIVTSIVVFLGPIVTAIVGAGIARSQLGTVKTRTGWEIGGALAGLAIGALTAWWVMPSIKKRFYEKRHS